jgi:peptidoglycan/LPS O-acetylase OafA/YrhL
VGEFLVADKRREHVQIVGLDLVRFFAAMMVMAYHLGFWCFVERDGSIGSSRGAFGPTPQIAPSMPFAQYGWVGVQIFFVISGFVIAYSANGESIAKYLKGRIIRLLPTAWICATITTVLLVSAGLYNLTAISDAYAKALTLYPLGPWIDGVYWTLPVEISFYTVILFFLGANAMGKAEAVFTVVGIVSSFAWLLLFSTHYWQPVYDLFGFEAIRFRLMIFADKLVFHRVSQLLLLVHGCFFATGFILWAASRRGFTLRRLASLAFINAGGIACVIESNILTASANTSATPAVAMYIMAVMFIIFSVKFNHLFPRRYMREIGLATYPLYLLHNVIGSFLIGHVFLPRMSALLASLTAMAICLALVFLVVRPVEARVQRLLRLGLSSLGSLGLWSGSFTEYAVRPTTALE